MGPSEHKPDHQKTGSRDTPRLNQIVAEFLDAVDAGDAPDRGKLLETYSDLVDDLTAFFADYDSQRAGLAGGDPNPPDLISATDEAATNPPHGATDELPTVPPDDSHYRSPPANFGNATTVPRGNRAADSLVNGTDTYCFGDYELLEEIARGGMGVVYKARQISLDRLVALKMILSGQLASEQDVQRFHTEAQAAANLSHPGIVPIFEVGHHDGQHYFSMAFVEGESLSERMAAGPQAPDEAAELVRLVAESVQYAHDRGVIHRDLKPANVLMDSHDEPRVTDFGLAKKVGVDSDLTATGAVIGTPSYMAPEQARGVKEIGPTADVYSLGGILYALLTGEPPFQAGTELETILQVIEQEPSSPRGINRAVNRNLETICLKCLEKDPRRRYATAQELADDLQRYLDGEIIVARPLGLWGQFRRWARSRPALAATFVVLSLFYLNHLFAYYVLPGTTDAPEYHIFITGLMLGWGAAAALFQYLARRPGAGVPVVYAWAGVDVLMFSFLLAVANGPQSTILFGYLLLVAGAALRFRIGLVWFVTTLTMLAYVGLVLETLWHRPQLAARPEGILPFLMGLFTMGLVGHILLLRVRKLYSGDSHAAKPRTGRRSPIA